MSVGDWFFDWMREHIDFTGWPDWPDTKTKSGMTFYAGFMNAMVNARFTRDMATAATNALAGRPDPGRGLYLDAVLEYARSIRRVERDADHVAAVAQRKQRLARWGALPETEQAPIRDRVLASHPYWQTVPGMLRLFCAECLDDATILEPREEPTHAR